MFMSLQLVPQSNQLFLYFLSFIYLFIIYLFICHGDLTKHVFIDILSIHFFQVYIVLFQEYIKIKNICCFLCDYNAFKIRTILLLHILFYFMTLTGVKGHMWIRRIMKWNTQHKACCTNVEAVSLLFLSIQILKGI